MKAPRLLWVAVVVLLLAGVAALLPAYRHQAAIGGEGRLEPNGRVVLTRDDRPMTVTRSLTLETGDLVEVGDSGARVRLPGGDVLELRPRAVLMLDRGPTLRNGTLLVTSAGPPRTVRAAGNQVDATGDTRIDVTSGLRVASYAGRAVLRSGGRTLEVPALREAAVPIVGVLRGPRALVIDASDPWDQRLLGDVVSREADVESLARGFTGQVSGANATAATFYRGLFPGLSGRPEFQELAVDRLGRALDRDPQGSPQRFRAGDVLLGAAVALQGRLGTFADRLAGAASFRADGASWTLVARDQQVPSIDALVRMVDSAVNGAPLELAAPGAPRGVTPAAVPLPTPVPVTPAPPTTAAPILRPAPTTTTTGPTRTTPTTLPQAQQPPPAPGTVVLPLDPLLDAVVDPVTKLLNDLLHPGQR